MEQNILERLQAESEALCGAVQKAAKKKWNVTDYQKISPELYIVKAANVKKPDKLLCFKCFYVQGVWSVWAYEDEEKLKASISTLKKL